jgi:TP901 family phage tail tape measure protein
VVGTAFKTLFARIEGLKLGETLEDGTTLNKYSKALDTIGVRIKETNGDMRSMNDILDDIGSKWKGLNKDTQIGLAQSIGGARQYATFMALMDNWDYFE